MAKYGLTADGVKDYQGEDERFDDFEEARDYALSLCMDKMDVVEIYEYDDDYKDEYGMLVGTMFAPMVVRNLQDTIPDAGVTFYEWFRMDLFGDDLPTMWDGWDDKGEFIDEAFYDAVANSKYGEIEIHDLPVYYDARERIKPVITEQEYRRNLSRVYDEEVAEYLGKSKKARKSKTKKYLPAGTDEYATADEVASSILNNIDGIEHIEAEPYHGYGHDDVDVRVWLDEYTDIQDVVDAIVDYPDVVDLEDNQDGSYTFTVITGYALNKRKSKARKGETKIPVSEDDTVEIEEMDGRRYVEIESKDEHAEEVATGYEQEGDDLNTEENITRPDTSKPKKSKVKKSAPVKIQSFPEGMKKCTEYQFANKRNALMESEIEDIIGTNPKRFLADAVAVGKAQRIKCSDGYAYRFKM